jgi:hypothetical protein
LIQRLFILLLAALSTPFLLKGQVVINECMTKNYNGITDEDGEHSDWIELYNSGSLLVNLGGYALSDDESEPQKWVFPTVQLAPGEFIVVFCSGKNRFGPELHTNFKLSEEEHILLTDLTGTTIDTLIVEEVPYDVSFGSVLDGAESKTAYYTSTPGTTNFDGVVYNRMELSQLAGFYATDFDLTVTASEPHTIHYTLDGSEPTANHPVYNSIISIRNRTNDPMGIASIPTTSPNIGAEIAWEQPLENPHRGTVVRLRSFNAGQPTSHTISASYFVNPLAVNRFSLPVVSIITDSLNLFQYDTGIYVAGYHYDLDPNGGHPDWGNGNFHQSGDEWERHAHFELFSKNGQVEVSQGVGIRIHGSGSRAYPQKSLRLYARGIYGKEKLDEDIFPGSENEAFDVLVLRNFGQDFVTGMAQDVLANRLITNMNQLYLEDRAVITFINGEYWGIQNIRERYDKHFLSAYHELDEDSIDIIDGYYGDVNVGDNVAYLELFNFIEANDLSIQSNYDWVTSRLDVEDFIDNTLTRIYLGCYDWPGNNLRMWRERRPEGKFRWLLLDNDRCMGNAAYNSLEHATYPDSPGWPNPWQSTLFLRRLLMKPEFRTMFINRMAELLNTEFDRMRVATIITNLYNTYQGSYLEHDRRWSGLLDGTTLQHNYQDIIDVVEVRSCYVKEHFMDYFDLEEWEFDYECDQSELYLGIEPTDAEQLTVYPNPSNGEFDLILADGKFKNGTIEVLNMNGALIYSTVLTSNIGRIVLVDPGGLSSGVYVLRVVSDSNTYSQKLIIQKR